MFKKIRSLISSERRGLKPAAQDSLSGWALGGLIAGVSAGGLGLGTLAGRYILPKQYMPIEAPKE